LPSLNGPLPPATNTVSAAAPSDVPRLALPSITTPPDEPLVMPGAAAKPNELPPLPSMSPEKPPVPPVPATPVGHTEPAVPLPPVLPVVPTVAGSAPVPPELPAPSVPPPAPTAPLPAPAGTEAPPVLPLPAPSASPVDPPKPVPAPPLAVPLPEAPVNPPKPVAIPPVPPTKPSATVEPLVPHPVDAPKVAPAPVALPTPTTQPPARPTPAPLATSVTETSTQGPGEALAGTKYIVMKDDKIIEGAVTLRGDVVVVRQGALDRSFSKGQVQFVADNKDEVYKYQLAKVPATDIPARLKVARWCMFSGMREQALTEAREVQKLQPANADAASLVRSLEQSLRQFPPADAPRMTAPATPTFPAELSARPVAPGAGADPDLAPEAINLFGAKVQPILANQCVSCHAKPDHAGTFRLVRVDPAGAGHQQTKANLLAVTKQIRKDDPAASPLLVMSITAHGGQKAASLATRQAVAYRTLEAWVALAVGTPSAVPPALPAPSLPAATPPAPPTTSVPAPDLPPALPPVPPPAVGVPLLPPVTNPLPPGAPVTPELPPAAPVAPSVPVTPPAPGPNPALPPLPASPPALPPVPATPPAPALPVPPAPPQIPAADPLLPPAPVPAGPVLPNPTGPTAPPIPPASEVPAVPLPPLPATGGFGSAAPPKPPVTGPVGDEFDPSAFNQGLPK
ncbi:MAG TPA: hypothetical protein VGE74_02510, partial [Gemmata sp.]